LPLVSHALLETWRRRKAETLTLAAYRGVGGIAGAITQMVERVFAGFDPVQQHIAQQMFLRSTALGEGTEDTRRQVPMAELLGGPNSTAARPVLDRLATARLLTVDERGVQVAHEAVIRHWPRLRGWLNNDRELLHAHRRLTEAAADWDQHGRDDGLLYRGARLAAWNNRGLERLNTAELAFLTASRHHARQRTTKHHLIRLAATSLICAAVAVVSVLAAIAG
jgi:hypothetical protein